MIEKYDIDQHEFDWIILGTDLPESILVATLANQGKKVLNLDFDSQYSGSLKSLNLKELAKFMELENTHKDEIY